MLNLRFQKTKHAYSFIKPATIAGKIGKIGKIARSHDTNYSHARIAFLGQLTSRSLIAFSLSSMAAKFSSSSSTACIDVFLPSLNKQRNYMVTSGRGTWMHRALQPKHKKMHQSEWKIWIILGSETPKRKAGFPCAWVRVYSNIPQEDFTF